MRNVGSVTGVTAEPPLLLTVEQAAFKLGLHRSRIFPLIASKQIASVKIGKSRRIVSSALEQYIQRLLDEQADGLSA